MNILLLDKLFNRAKPKEIVDLEQAIERKSSLDKEIQDLNDRIKLLQDEIENKSKCLEEIKDELNIGENRIVAEDLGVHFEPINKNIKSIENDIDSVKTKIAKMLKDKSYCTLTRHYTVDSSERKGKELVEAFCENNILGFNLYCEKKRKAITKENYQHTIDLIDKAFWRYSKRAKIVAAEFNKPYLDLNKKLCTLELGLKVKKQQDKERVREEKRKLREEQQMLAEAEKERKKLEAERANLQKLFAKAITEQEQEEIKAKLAKVDKRVEEIDWRTSHYSAGWLYITTTPSMPNIYKCGCTKQINPLNRLAQLSSASVPFPFECRGLVFSENVFDLEAKMHRRLDSKRVNKGNKLKEFFYGEPEEAIKILTDEFHEEVRFIDEHWIDSGKDNGNEIG